jgi:hypothetical protein
VSRCPATSQLAGSTDSRAPLPGEPCPGAKREAATSTEYPAGSREYPAGSREYPASFELAASRSQLDTCESFFGRPSPCPQRPFPSMFHGCQRRAERAVFCGISRDPASLYRNARKVYSGASPGEVGPGSQAATSAQRRARVSEPGGCRDFWLPRWRPGGYQRVAPLRVSRVSSLRSARVAAAARPRDRRPPR